MHDGIKLWNALPRFKLIIMGIAAHHVIDLSRIRDIGKARQNLWMV